VGNVYRTRYDAVQNELRQVLGSGVTRFVKGSDAANISIFCLVRGLRARYRSLAAGTLVAPPFG
jgi:hypothetical protein